LTNGDEWAHIDRGHEQRLAGLNAFVCDLYGDQRVVKEGVFPREVLATSRFFLPKCVGMRPKFRAPSSR